jgi:hypothetical protein
MSSPSDHWYAFAESEDFFAGSGDAPGDDEWLKAVLAARKELGLSAPSRIVWLSCIRAEYFESLEWRDEPCDPEDEKQSNQRRSRLLDLKESQLKVVPLLLSEDESREADAFGSIGEHDWHRIRVERDGRIPIWEAQDFDLENDGLQNRLDYLGPCTEGERKELRKVFNLDFLRDEELGGEEERGPPTPTITPEPGSGVRMQLPKYQELHQDTYERGAS